MQIKNMYFWEEFEWADDNWKVKTVPFPGLTA